MFRCTTHHLQGELKCSSLKTTCCYAAQQQVLTRDNTRNGVLQTNSLGLTRESRGWTESSVGSSQCLHSVRYCTYGSVKSNCGTKISPYDRPWKPRGVGVQPYSFFNLGARYWWVVNATSRKFYPRETDPVPMVQESEWAPGPVCSGAINLGPPPGFDPRDVEPVENRYTVYVIPAHQTVAFILQH